MSRPWAQVVMVATLSAGLLIQTGCETKAETGALTGGAIGTAAGALIGGNIAGAAIGGGVGALTGAVVGSSMDQADRAAATATPAPVQTFHPLKASDVEDWILNNRVDKINNLGPYTIQQKELDILNHAYANQQFSAQGPKLSTLQIAYLYGVICYFQSTSNPICNEPPKLGEDALMQQNPSPSN
jgi:hypothetical protein